MHPACCAVVYGWLLAAAVGLSAAAHSVTGRVDTLAAVFSPELGNRRDVLVWLPPGYEAGHARYPVLYMQDGRNVFDRATAFVGKEWRADEAADALARRGHGLIVVAIAAAESAPGGGGRLSEYSPWPMPKHQATGLGHLYAEFVARTLKPLIDARYRTQPGRDAAGIAGSSMGGLISLFAALRHPDVFGFAAALSPSLWFADGAALEWAERNAPALPVRVYLDVGSDEGETPEESQRTVEQTRAMARLLEAQGLEVRCVTVAGARHDEDAWAARLPAVLEWFLENDAPSQRSATFQMRDARPCARRDS